MASSFGWAQTPPSPDGKSPETLVSALYDVISGPGGQARDWDRMRSLFAPGARLTPVVRRPDGTGAFRPMTVDEYIEQNRKFLETQGFFESEVAKTTESFGGISHVFSTYESRLKKGDKPIARGINSIQLVHDGTRWWIANLTWQAEGPNLPLPKKYGGAS
ncbi:MAG: hypothetical protein H6534_02650 [Chthonomonadaceae bacterium]|nr:hypothetical protein [Chthonomonadaceae bacterium]